jgi:hypothetical protein
VLDLTQHRLEGRQISMNVGQDGDAMAHALFLKKSLSLP